MVSILPGAFPARPIHGATPSGAISAIHQHLSAPLHFIRLPIANLACKLMPADFLLFVPVLHKTMKKTSQLLGKILFKRPPT